MYKKGVIRLKNWRTTLFGAIQNVSWVSVFLMLGSPEVMTALGSVGVGPVFLTVLGGVAKLCKDASTKDAAVSGTGL